MMDNELEALYWSFDTVRKQTGAERDAFKNAVRGFVQRREAQVPPCKVCGSTIHATVACHVTGPKKFG
jgi:hypothetical protein